MEDLTLQERLSQGTLDQLCINTLRTLAMDAVELADSGHPGTPMALAPAAYVLWREIMHHNPRNPNWINRDRFVLSCGHASMLLYGLLHLSGYELSLDDIKQFRQWGSRTPGHPEYGMTPGVETTTGPLGQGLMQAVGMATAEAHLAAMFNHDGHDIIDHHTYVFCSDGDMMEGASHEAASVAGHLGLGKLIFLYDDNHISIDGPTELTYSDDVAARFGAYHWHVQNLGDKANDLDALRAAFRAAQQNTHQPSLIIVRSHIAFGAPHAQDTSAAHGAPLGAEEVHATKMAYGWPADKSFYVPPQVSQYMGELVEKGARAEQGWQSRWQVYRRTHPEFAHRFQAALANELPEGWDDDLPQFHTNDAPVATRAAAHTALNHFAARIPWLLGGAADLASSTKAEIENDGDFERGNYRPRNIHWGIREHVMCAAACGMALHGGVRPFASTFFIFSDYARPAIRLAALMSLPVIYVLSHDSIGLGEDGPTHQPIEHLASFRAMPGMCVIRPADANETVQAWRVALARHEGPTMLILSRQKLPVLQRKQLADARLLERGAYVISHGQNKVPELILIASGSELHLALAAQARLYTDHNIDARVVSMPSWELFRCQDEAYRNEVLPPKVSQRVAVEAGSSMGWHEWVGDNGVVLGIDRFGASAPAEEIFHHFGLDVTNIVGVARELLNSGG
jgi:transketolase